MGQVSGQAAARLAPPGLDRGDRAAQVRRDRWYRPVLRVGEIEEGLLRWHQRSQGAGHSVAALPLQQEPFGVLRLRARQGDWERLGTLAG